MTIDEADNSQQYLISNNIGNDMLSTFVDHEGTRVRKASLLKHAMSGTAHPKLFDRTKISTGFSYYKNTHSS